MMTVSLVKSFESYQKTDEDFKKELSELDEEAIARQLDALKSAFQSRQMDNNEFNQHNIKLLYSLPPSVCKSVLYSHLMDLETTGAKNALGGPNVIQEVIEEKNPDWSKNSDVNYPQCRNYQKLTQIRDAIEKKDSEQLFTLLENPPFDHVLLDSNLNVIEMITETGSHIYIARLLDAFIKEKGLETAQTYLNRHQSFKSLIDAQNSNSLDALIRIFNERNLSLAGSIYSKREDDVIFKCENYIYLKKCLHQLSKEQINEAIFYSGGAMLWNILNKGTVEEFLEFTQFFEEKGVTFTQVLNLLDHFL